MHVSRDLATISREQQHGLLTIVCMLQLSESNKYNILSFDHICEAETLEKVDAHSSPEVAPIYMRASHTHDFERARKSPGKTRGQLRGLSEIVAVQHDSIPQPKGLFAFLAI